MYSTTRLLWLAGFIAACKVPVGPVWCCTRNPAAGTESCYWQDVPKGTSSASCDQAVYPPSQPKMPGPQEVRVTPEQGTVATGDTIQFIGIPYDSLNRVFVEPSEVVWSISDSTVARIIEGPVHFDNKSANSTSVRVLGVAAGTATLTATVIVNNGGSRTSGTANVTTF